MSLSVLNNIAAIYAQNNLNQTQSSLQNTLTQLSSGSRINSGSDDAAGLSIANGLGANIAALTQSSQNAADGIGVLQTADGALSQVTNLLNRAVTLSTQAANTDLTTGQVSSANQEYQNILSEIGNIGATTNFNSNNVFSGVAKQIFISDGTASGSNTFSDVVGVLSKSSVGLTAATGAASTLTPSTGTTSSATPTVSTATVTLGSATDTVTGNISLSIATGTGTTVTHSINGSGLAGGALAAAITADATFAAEGITASYAGSVLTIKGPTTGNGTVVINTNAFVTSTGSAPVTLSAPSTGSTGGSSVTVTPVGLSDTFSGTLTLGLGAGATHSITLASGTTGTAFAAKVNADTTYAAAGISAAYNATSGVITLTGPAAASSQLVTTGSTISDTPGPGVGADFTVAAVATLSATSATQVLTTVTSAIADVAYQRGIIGANINQLSAASNVASSESVNLTSAQSSILSTNYGSATSDLAKFKVLSSTGISALAQANSVQQEVTKLLQ